MESNNNNLKNARNLGLLIGIPLIILLAMWLLLSGRSANQDKQYSDYIAYFQNNQVQEFKLNLGSGDLEFLLREQYRTEDTNKDGKIDHQLPADAADYRYVCGDVGDDAPLAQWVGWRRQSHGLWQSAGKKLQRRKAQNHL